MSLLEKTVREDGKITVPARVVLGWKGEIRAYRLKLETEQARVRHQAQLRELAEARVNDLWHLATELLGHLEDLNAEVELLTGSGGVGGERPHDSSQVYAWRKLLDEAQT